MGNKAAVSHYISAKHAMNGFTKAVAFEYGQQGITSNAICPGAIETDLMVEVGPSFAAETGVTYERSAEHTSELQSLMRLSYAVFCLTKKNQQCHRSNNHKLTKSNI